MTADELIMTTYGNSDIAALEYGTAVLYYCNYRLVGKYYVTSVSRTAKGRYRLNCSSFVGILDRKTFYGGFYEGARFADVAREILGGNALDINTAHEYLRVYGRSYVSGTYPNMASRHVYLADNLFIKFRYDGVGQTEFLPEGTLSWCVGFCGVWVSPNWHSYALYAPIERESEDAPWIAGALTLAFDSEKIEGPILQLGHEYSVEVYPTEGRYVVNGVTYSFEPYTSTSGEYSFIRVGIVQHEYGTAQLRFYGFEGDVLSYEISESTLGTFHEPCRLIPAHRKNDNKNGMYDLHSGRFFASTTRTSTDTPATLGPQIAVNIPGFENPDAVSLSILNDITYDEGIADYEVWGWLPAGTKRDALHQLLFASSVNVIKDENGSVVFAWIYNSDDEPLIPPSRIYLGGDYDYAEKANRVDLTEHRYFYDAEEKPVTLFDNTDGYTASATTVTFSKAPIYVDSLVTTGSLAVNAANINAAIVSGVGTLTGIPYQHTRNVISMIADNAAAGKTVTIPNATLVSIKNSENILQRAFSYYAYKTSIKNAIVLQNERCGQKYRFTDPFGREATGFLATVGTVVSGIVKANCEFVADYIPGATSGEYTHGAVLTGSGTFTVPAAVFDKDVPKMKVILIQGGTGGSSGYAGENGQQLITYNATDIPQTFGGAMGEPGDGGKILELTLVGSDILTEYEYTCGEGGEGGAVCSSHTVSNAGTEGEETVFGEYSSSGGERHERGTLNFTNGKRYGGKFSSSKGFASPGGDNYWARSSRYMSPNSIYVFDESAIKRAQWAGESPLRNNYRTVIGTGLDSLRVRWSWLWEQYWVEVDGGNPGAAAAGSNGGNGTAAYKLSEPGWAHSGDGGNGGDALTPGIDAQEANPDNYGWGGYGGSGGGAGGNSGRPVSIWIPDQGRNPNYVPGTPGRGGYGSKGGKGGDGCILIYW